MKRLANKVAVITGGAAGIGKAAAEKFYQEGAKVFVWDSAQPQHTNYPLNFNFLQVNVADPNAVEHAAQSTVAAAGHIDILINNAGITRDASFRKMTKDQWQQVIDVNLTGVFNCCKSIAPLMIQNNYGRIINTSSIVGLYGNYGQANYAATKGGIIAFSKTLARELGQHGITVNAVAPGFIATDMILTVPEKVIQSMKDKIPLHRLGTPADIAAVYAFLASDEAGFISGSVVSVDGGMTI